LVIKTKEEVMDHRKLIACLLVMLMPLVTAFMACNGGGGNGDEDADGDAEEDPTGDDTVTDPVPDPAGDDGAGDPVEDPVPDPTDDDGVTPDTVEDPVEDEVADVVEEEVITELTVEEYCAGQFMVLCNYIATCCTTDEADADIFTDLDCDDYTQNDGYDECVDSIGDAIDGGTLQFNLGSVAACQAATATLIASCPGYNLFESQFDALGLGACGDILEGLVADGDACDITAECADGYCSGMDDTCHAYLATGDTCMSNRQCAPGESCIGGVCAALSGDGEDCDGGGAGAGDCEAGFYCSGGSCTAYLDADEECRFAECVGYCDTSPNPDVCIDFCDGP
jgi:hypothetical protein